MIPIPFNEPVVLEEHPAALLKSLQSKHISGVGPATLECEQILNKLNNSNNLIVSSATHALEMMALLANIQEGDEVILPSYTFVSTANAFALRRARLRFADNDHFGNIKVSEVERLISPKTKAVVAVHYAGNSCNMNQMADLCQSKGLLLFEDAAQCIDSFYNDKPLGTIGSLGCLSFHETKNVCAGEGGALIVNHSAFLERAEVIRQKGTNRKQFLSGLADKYTWVDIGSSYVLSDLNSSYLLPQLQSLKMISEKRKLLWNNYLDQLNSICLQHGVEVLKSPSHNRSNHHIFALIFKNKVLRDHFIQDLKREGIMTAFHYVSLHKSPFGKRYSTQSEDSLPECERLSDCLVRLPLFFNLSNEKQDFVIQKTISWIKKNS